MSWGIVAGAGASIIGGMMSSDAAGDAASAQSQSSQQATQAQMMAIAQMRKDLEPWTRAGVAAQGLLSRYLGTGVGGSGVTSMGLQTGLTPDQVRQQLLSRFTSTKNNIAPNALPGAATGWKNPDGSDMTNAERMAANLRDINEAPIIGYARGGSGIDATQQAIYGTTAAPTSSQVVDEDGLNAAIKAYYDEQQALTDAAAKDPNYGSLLRAYRNGAEFDSGPAFSFTGQDLASEPGYQFGLNQGTQGIERGQASRGNFLSGAAMKELARFNEDYAGTKYNDAFNRASSSYNTNLNRRQNEWNTNLNAYNTNRNTIYNFLTGQSQIGQNSAAQVGAAGNNAATNIGNNMMAAGNANAAGIVAGSNSMVSGINNAVNGINSAGGWNSLLSSFNRGTSGNNYSGSSNNVSAPNYVNSIESGFY